MSEKIIALRRDKRFSLGAEERDRDILEAVILRMGGKVTMMDEAGLTEEFSPEMFVTMGRLPEKLSILKKKEREGTRVVNSPFAIEQCTRSRMEAIMRENNIPMPPLKGGDGYWIKRGDDVATGDNGIGFCRNESELRHVKAKMRRLGITSFIVSANIIGDIVKFYCVGNEFFRWYRQGEAVGNYDFDAEELHKNALKIARLIGIDVYGGDCVVTEDGNFYIIDFNDWPSFKACKDEAADAIAALIKEKYGEI